MRPGINLNVMTASRPAPARNASERSEIRASGDAPATSPDDGRFPALRAGSPSNAKAGHSSRLRLPALIAIGLHVLVGSVLTGILIMEPFDSPHVAPAIVAVRPDETPPPVEPDPEPLTPLPPTEVAMDRMEPLVEAPIPDEADEALDAIPERTEVFHPGGPPAFDGPTVAHVRRRRAPPAVVEGPTMPQTATFVATGPTRSVALLEGGCPDPVYPRRERERGIQGTTRLKFLVNVDGTIDRAEVAVSSGHDPLDEAARSAALRWRFLPALKDGVAIPSWAWRDVRFILQ
jgi:protein TonB